MSPAWGPTGKSACPELGVETPGVGRARPGLADPAPTCRRALPPTLPGLRSGMGGVWIPNSAPVPIFKRQMQFFFCSILIAKMFNLQTFVFPGKCF